MLHAEALKSFRGKYEKPLHVAARCALAAYIDQNYGKLRKDLIDCFGRLFGTVAKAQREKAKGEIAFVVLSVLRTGVSLGTGRCLLSAYDKNWYADKQPLECEYDASWLLGFLVRYGNALRQKSLEYVGKATRADAERIRDAKFAEYSRDIAALCRKCVDGIVALGGYAEIEKHEVFDIRVGEYFDLTESVWNEDGTAKDSAEEKTLLQKKYPYECTFRHYKALDLSNGDYAGANFMRTRFESVDFSGSNLASCELTGAKFLNCNLADARMEASRTLECDFSGSCMARAALRGMNPGTVIADSAAVGRLFIGMRFDGADLRGADLSHGVLTGASFRRAALDGCDFDGAILRGAIMDMQWRGTASVNLTDEQRGGIVWA
jgi:uncharacterized protein YjbI with pentapeptide repeats